jgi:hypothetical protein
MSIMLDILGSVVVGAMVIVLGLSLDTSIAGSATARNADVTVQENLVELVRNIEYDFRKIGYGLKDPSAAMLLADTNKLRFQTDINNDGTMDHVEWRVGAPVSHFENKNIRPLGRYVNGVNTGTTAGLGVTLFSLRYYDQDGTLVGGGIYPINASDLKKIWIVEITLKIESPYRVQDVVMPTKSQYSAAIWRQTRLTSRNVSRW